MQHNLIADDIAQFVFSHTGHVLDVIVHDTIDSTNSWCITEIRQGRKLPFACFARKQTQGRGRRGKSWLMPAQSNIALSLAWPFDITSTNFPLLPINIAVAMVDVLSKIGINDIQIKWPNDVYVSGKKVAGILIETRKMNTQEINSPEIVARKIDTLNQVPDTGGDYAVVIGIGLNYDMNIDANAVNSPLFTRIGSFTDVITETQHQGINTPGLARVAETLLSQVVNTCVSFETNAKVSLEAFRRHYDFCYDKPVRVQLGNEVLDAVGRGVTDTAELQVQIGDEIRCFNSADVSVRPQTTASGYDKNNT